MPADDDKKRRGPRRDDGKPGTRAPRAKRADGAQAPAPGAAAPAAKRVRAKKPEGAAPADKAGE